MAKGQARATLDQDQIEASLARVSAIGARNSGLTTNEIFTEIRKVLGTPLDTLVLTEERIDSVRARLARLHRQCDELMIPDPHEFLKSEEARNFIEVFDLCMLAARNRTESRESFYRSDYPYTDNVEWMGWHAVRIDGGKPVFSRERLPMERYRRQPTEKLPDRELSPLARILDHPEAKKAEAAYG
jgi:succinate dehydrogenase/fumarate reductase flavoprotein subunit